MIDDYCFAIEILSHFYLTKSNFLVKKASKNRGFFQKGTESVKGRNQERDGIRKGKESGKGRNQEKDGIRKPRKMVHFPSN